MLDVLQPYLKKFQRSSESNDVVDRFSYQYTATILAISAIAMATSQYVGKPIQCWVPAHYTGQWEKYAEAYCFVKGTYFSGYGSKREEEDSEAEKARVGYYQWIPIVLILQAFLFYLPSLIWRSFNECCELKIKEFAMISDKSRKKTTLIADDLENAEKFGKYFFKKLTFRNESLVFKKTSWFVASGSFLPILFLLTKMMYLANIVLQFWLLSWFLETKSWMWGWDTFKPYLKKFQRSSESNDVVDRFSYQYTAIILAISAIAMATSQYVGKPIQCWVPAHYTGQWEKYAEAYCFVKGTYFSSYGSQEEEGDGVAEKARVGYYQWIPIVLILQAFLFYLPSLIWRFFNECCELKIKEFAAISEESRKKTTLISDDLENAEKFGKYFFKKLTFRNESLVFKKTSWFVASGSFLPILFLLTKMMYLANIVLQFWLLTWFLETNSWMWGWDTFKDLATGRQWQTTGIFPRVTTCDFSIMDLTTIHDHTIQCVIVINMLAEKVYVFFWFWLLFVGVLTGVSLVYWSAVYMLPSVGRSFVYSYLSTKTHSHLKAMFVDKCLTADGVFICRLVQQNSGDLFTSIMLKKMFSLYRKRETEKEHKKNDDDYSELDFGALENGDVFL